MAIYACVEDTHQHSPTHTHTQINANQFENSITYRLRRLWRRRLWLYALCPVLCGARGYRRWPDNEFTQMKFAPNDALPPFQKANETEKKLEIV